MIIVRGNIVADKAQAKNIVTATPTGFLIETPDDGVVFEFDKSKLEFAPDIAYLTKNVFNKPVLFWQSELGHSRDAYSSIALRKKISMTGMQAAHATFCVDSKGVAHVVIHGDTFIENDDGTAVIVGSDICVTACDIFQEKIPEIGDFMRHSRVKVQALARFNALDAVAGLEYQVDLLTAAVKALVSELPVEKRPEWWSAFEAAVTPNASYNLIGATKAVQNIESEKVKAREGQVEYFNKLTNG